jgi:hypothetical protein
LPSLPFPYNPLPYNDFGEGKKEGSRYLYYVERGGLRRSLYGREISVTNLPASMARNRDLNSASSGIGAMEPVPRFRGVTYDARRISDHSVTHVQGCWAP